MATGVGLRMGAARVLVTVPVRFPSNLLVSELKRHYYKGIGIKCELRFCNDNGVTFQD